MRGKETHKSVTATHIGITPAYAGKSGGAADAERRFRDHPRVCGEKFCILTHKLLPMGSPPRMRGKVNSVDPETGKDGITPAYAGKRCGSSSPAGPRWDHPRVCGEKIRSQRDEDKLVGSPPRMRGKVSRHAAGRLYPGITPAYAGKSRFLWTDSGARRDHPRVCGEKLQPAMVRGMDPGSPPRMRGKVRPCFLRPSLLGITPAYAGKSSLLISWRTLIRDHPRVCGEKLIEFISINLIKGSPPRMRGKDSESLEIQVLLFSSAHFSFNF